MKALKITNPTDLYDIRYCLVIFSCFLRTESHLAPNSEVKAAVKFQQTDTRHLITRSQQPNFELRTTEEFHTLQKAINKIIELEEGDDLQISKYQILQKKLTERGNTKQSVTK